MTERPHIKLFMEAAALLVSCEMNDQHMKASGDSGPAPVDPRVADRFNELNSQWKDRIRELGPEHAADRIVNDVWFPALMECAPEVGEPLIDFWLATVVTARW